MYTNGGQYLPLQQNLHTTFHRNQGIRFHSYKAFSHSMLTFSSAACLLSASVSAQLPACQVLPPSDLSTANHHYLTSLVCDKNQSFVINKRVQVGKKALISLGFSPLLRIPRFSLFAWTSSCIVLTVVQRYPQVLAHCMLFPLETFHCLRELEKAGGTFHFRHLESY